MIASAAATRDYTSDEIAPLCLPNSSTLRAADGPWPIRSSDRSSGGVTYHPAFVYREAAINPTESARSSDGWEADIVNHRSAASLKEAEGERVTRWAFRCIGRGRVA